MFSVDSLQCPVREEASSILSNPLHELRSVSVLLPCGLQPLPLFSVSVADTGLSRGVSGLESTVARWGRKC